LVSAAARKRNLRHTHTDPVCPGDVAAVPEAQTYTLMLAGLGAGKVRNNKAQEII